MPGSKRCRRVQKNTVEKRLLNARGLPNFGLNFYILNAKGEYAGVSLYDAHLRGVHRERTGDRSDDRVARRQGDGLTRREICGRRAGDDVIVISDPVQLSVHGRSRRRTPSVDRSTHADHPINSIRSRTRRHDHRHAVLYVRCASAGSLRSAACSISVQRVHRRSRNMSRSAILTD